jgi:hypothetical protein
MIREKGKGKRGKGQGERDKGKGGNIGGVVDFPREDEHWARRTRMEPQTSQRIYRSPMFTDIDFTDIDKARETEVHPNSIRKFS